MKYLRMLFGDVLEGRVARLPYLIYILLIHIVLMVSMVFALPWMSTWMAGSLEEASARGEAGPILDAMLQLPMASLLILAVVGLIFFWTQANLTAKRLRDTGLPGWTTLIAWQLLNNFGALAHPLLPVVTTVIGLAYLCFAPTDLMREPPRPQ